jgi:hypothetical protein
MNSRKRWLPVGCCLLVGFIVAVSWLRHEQNSPPDAKAYASLGETNRQTGFPIRKRPFPQRPMVQAPTASFEENAEALAQQSVEARMKFASELEGKSSAELFDVWRIEVKAKRDPLKLDFVADALATRLRDVRTDSFPVLREIQQFFMDSGNDDYSRWRLAQILSQAATRETLAVLLELIEATHQPESRAWLLEQIVKSSQNNWGGQFHEDFTDLLGKAWQSTTAQSDSAMALGFAIASVGSPDGLELLFSDIKDGGQTVREFEQKADDKAWVAFGSLEQVRNPAAIPFLSSKLSAIQSHDSIAASAAGYCLAKMGQPEATAVLLRWVRANPTDVGVFVTDWFMQMRDGGSVELVNTAVKGSDFANHRNKDALSSALTLWLSQRSENVRPVSEQ